MRVHRNKWSMPTNGSLGGEIRTNPENPEWFRKHTGKALSEDYQQAIDRVIEKRMATREAETKFGNPPEAGERRSNMPAGSFYDDNQGADPQIVDEGVMKTLLEFANRMAKEGDKTTAEIARHYGHNLSQRTPEIRWGTPGRSIIDVQRGFLGRKDPTDVARQNAAKTIEDLHKLLAYFHANRERFIEYAHYLLTESRRRVAERNDLLPDDIRDYGHLIELIAADSSLRTFADSLEMIDTISKTEITRAMPQR
jgi:hypothetical protein